MPSHVSEQRRNNRKSAKASEALSAETQAVWAHLRGINSAIFAALCYFEQHRVSAFGGQVIGRLFLGQTKKRNNLNTNILFITFFFCLPKRRSKKKSPQLSLPCGLSCASRCWRDTEKSSAFSGLKQIQRLFPPTTTMLSGTNGGPEDPALVRPLKGPLCCRIQGCIL